MKLRILDRNGDTVVEVKDDPSLLEAERILEEHQRKGGSAFTDEGERVKSLKGIEAENVWLVPQMMGG